MDVLVPQPGSGIAQLLAAGIVDWLINTGSRGNCVRVSGPFRRHDATRQ
jgi:hypothetical protein